MKKKKYIGNENLQGEWISHTIRTFLEELIEHFGGVEGRLNEDL